MGPLHVGNGEITGLMKSEEKKSEEDTEVHTKYEQLQLYIFSFLEQPGRKLAIIYHITNLVFIFGSILIGVLSTIDNFESKENEAFHFFFFFYEIFLLVWFCIEYLLRVWSCGSIKKYRGFYGRLRFMKTFYMCVDVFIIITTIITAALHLKTSYFTLLRTTRFLQVFRILRLDRQKGDLSMMFRVVYTHRKELLTCYFVGFIILFGGAYVVFIIEKDQDKASITDMADGLYWALITVTSVGYGDISPVSWAGKMTTGIFAIVGCAFFALPAGILGSGFAIQVAKAKNQKKVFKIRNPAAIVIQTAWRNYAVRKYKNQCKATWKYLVPQIVGTASWPGYYSCLPGITAICNDKSFDAFNVATDEIKLMTPSWGRKQKLTSKTSTVSYVSHSSTDPETSPSSPCLSPKKSRKFSFPANFEGTSRNNSLTKKKKKVSKASMTEKQNKYKSAIRFILRIKFWTCIQTFRNKRYPFIEMQDIRDKSTQWHLEKISVLKELKNSTLYVKQEFREIALHMRVGQNRPFALKRKRK